MNSQAAKRYACDRCREQKLRCPRNKPDGSTCDRCLRAGVFCVTSSGRPLGRPPLHANDATRGHVDGNQSSCHAQRRSREQWRRGLSISTTSNPLQLPTPTASGSDSSEASTLLTRPPAHFDAMFNMRLDESDFPNDAFSSAGLSLDSSTSQPQFWSDSTSVLELDFRNLGDMAEPPPNKSLHSSTGDADDNDSGRSESSTPSAAVNGDSMALLISAIGSISRQLAELKKQSWDPYLIRVALFDGHDPDPPCNGPISFNSWENTLCVTMKFILVLQTMVPAHFSAAPPPCSPPTLPMTLMLLSTYIQLGELFDTILTRISNCLQEGPGHPEPHPQAATQRPFPAQPATLHIMMMIQVLEHQLHSVERVMGLPADCRLWSQKDAYAGILGQEESSALTQAVMGQAQETFRSLKQTIDRMQTSLRGSSSLSSKNSTR